MSTPQRDGRRAERREAARQGARPVRASGALPGSGGDFVRPDGALVEHKATRAASFRITKAMWDKIAGEARREMREPMMLINISGLRLEVRAAP